MTIWSQCKKKNYEKFLVINWISREKNQASTCQDISWWRGSAFCKGMHNPHEKREKNELLFDSLDRMVFRSEKIVFVSMMANLTKLWFLIKGSFDMQHRKGTSLKLFYASGSMKYNFLGVIWHFLWSLYQFNSYLILTISVILEKKTKKKSFDWVFHVSSEKNEILKVLLKCTFRSPVFCSKII